MRAQQHLTRVSLDALGPTQMTIGAAEVQAKRGQWGRLKRKEREGLLASHWFPAVLLAATSSVLSATPGHRVALQPVHADLPRFTWELLSG